MSSASSLNLHAESDIHRNVADFPPNIWGDYFLQYASESMVHFFFTQNLWYINMYNIVTLCAFFLTSKTFLLIIECIK